MLLGMVEDIHFSDTVGNCSGEQGEEASLCCPPLQAVEWTIKEEQPCRAEGTQ